MRAYIYMCMCGCMCVQVCMYTHVMFTFILCVSDSEKCTGEAMVLCAASDAERKEWIKGLCYHIYASRGGGQFGDRQCFVALETLMTHISCSG